MASPDGGYEYQIVRLGAVLRDLAANYLLCDCDAMGDWSPIFIGACDNIRDKLSQPDLDQWLLRAGVTHLHIRLNPLARARVAEKRDLIRRFNPPLQRRPYLRA